MTSSRAEKQEEIDQETFHGWNVSIQGSDARCKRSMRNPAGWLRAENAIEGGRATAPRGCGCVRQIPDEVHGLAARARAVFRSSSSSRKRSSIRSARVGGIDDERTAPDTRAPRRRSRRRSSCSSVDPQHIRRAPCLAEAVAVVRELVGRRHGRRSGRRTNRRAGSARRVPRASLRRGRVGR